ncbi:MAG: hypothetical protein J7J22_02075 [Candidatus Verstraetearchaeota archaeon]|nr:hypothetical protein [Candidatus Verstraetearchaeota archaeon]
MEIKELVKQYHQAFEAWKRVKGSAKKIREEMTGQVSYVLRCPVCGAVEERPSLHIRSEFKADEGEHTATGRPWPCLKCPTGELTEVVERRGPSDEEIRTRVKEARDREERAFEALEKARHVLEDAVVQFLEENQTKALRFLADRGKIRLEEDGTPLAYDEGWGRWMPVPEEDLERMLWLEIQEGV